MGNAWVASFWIEGVLRIVLTVNPKVPEHGSARSSERCSAPWKMAGLGNLSLMRRACRVLAPSLLSTGDKALEFLKPVLYENYLGHRRGLPLIELYHQESLSVGQ